MLERRATSRSTLREVAAECREVLFACARACGGYAGAHTSAKATDAGAADACAHSAGQCLTTYMLLESAADPAAWIVPLKACARACSECERMCLAATTITTRCAKAAQTCRRSVECCTKLVEAVREGG